MILVCDYGCHFLCRHLRDDRLFILSEGVFFMSVQPATTKKVWDLSRVHMVVIFLLMFGFGYPAAFRLDYAGGHEGIGHLHWPFIWLEYLRHALAQPFWACLL